MNSEIDSKLAKVRSLLIERGLDSLLIQKVTNFAWITGGASSYINTADNMGVASILITPNRRYLITNNIEAPRFHQEECLKDQGWEFKIYPWYEVDNPVDLLVQGLQLGADGQFPGAQDLSDDLVRLRMNLLPEEQERLRKICHGCGEAMKDAIAGIKPGMTEFEIAAILGSETQHREILPIVNLVATDERVYSFRHPLPTNKRLDRYAMLVLCGRKSGLVASITRLVHFGPMPDELRLKAEAVAEIDATFITATRPGRTLGEIFQLAQSKYAQLGFPDEWQLHHQGGPAGYMPREAIATPNAELVVGDGQAYAWNPSISGTKSEDTILVMADGVEILTEIPDWPSLSIEVSGQTILRPATLEIT